MKKSITTTGIGEQFGDRRAIELIAQAGFDGVDYSCGMVGWDWYKDDIYVNDHPFTDDKKRISYAKELKQIALDNGVVFNQIHSPAPAKPPVEDWIVKAVEFCAEMGCEYMIVHPYTADFDYNVRLISKFLHSAKEFNVKLSIENIWHSFENGLARGPIGCDEKSLYEIVNYFNSPNVVACLDVGHAVMKGLETSPEKIIFALKDKIKNLHIHDNDLMKDLHQIPFEGSIDYAPIMSALKQVGYDGFLTLESIKKDIKDKPESDTALFLKNSYESALKLEKMFK